MVYQVRSSSVVGRKSRLVDPRHLIATAYEVVHLIMSSISISAIIILCAPFVLLLVPSNLLTSSFSQWYLFAIYKAPNETIQDTIHHYIWRDLPCKLRYAPLEPELSKHSLTGADSFVYQCIY